MKLVCEHGILGRFLNLQQVTMQWGCTWKYGLALPLKGWSFSIWVVYDAVFAISDCQLIMLELHINVEHDTALLGPFARIAHFWKKLILACLPLHHAGQNNTFLKIFMSSGIWSNLFIRIYQWLGLNFALNQTQL